MKQKGYIIFTGLNVWFEVIMVTIVILMSLYLYGQFSGIR